MSDLGKRFMSFMLIFAVFSTSNLCIAGSVTAPRDNSTVIYSEKKDEIKSVKSSKRLEKSKTIAMIAAFFGVHHFYLKNNIAGVVYIGLGLVYGLGWVLSLIDIFVMLNMDDAEWNEYLSSEKSIIWL